MKYRIIKESISYPIYRVVDEDDKVIKEFDSYNHQAPYHRAKEFVKSLENEIPEAQEFAKDEFVKSSLETPITLNNA